MLGFLRRTCPLIKDRNVRRTLYLSLVKSQLSYATEVWSTSKSINKTIYKDRLLSLNLLPLSYDREIKDLTFFFKAMYGYYDLNVFDYVSFVSHSRTRNCVNPSLMLKVPSCKTSTFQSSSFNRIVPLWSCVCRAIQPSDLRSLTMFRSFLSRTYLHLLISCFDVDKTCTWSLHRTCPCHRV